MSRANIANQGFHTNPERRNKNGRPKKLPALVDMLDKVLLKTTAGKTQLELMVQALTDKAIQGDLPAIRCLLEFRYGKPKMSLDLTTTPEKDDDDTRLIAFGAGMVCDQYGNKVGELYPEFVDRFSNGIRFVDSGVRDDGNINELPLGLRDME